MIKSSGNTFNNDGVKATGPAGGLHWLYKGRFPALDSPVTRPLIKRNPILAMSCTTG